MSDDSSLEELRSEFEAALVKIAKAEEVRDAANAAMASAQVFIDEARVAHDVARRERHKTEQRYAAAVLKAHRDGEKDLPW